MEEPTEASHDIDRAVDAARLRNPRLDSSCFDFVRDVLLLHDKGHLFAEQREARLAFVMRWQQFTGPIVAKGLEDTVLYIYTPLLSLNEVGGNPSPSAITAPNFFELVREQQKHGEHGLNCTSTHDTKRGEDVRARINVLSEIPGVWQSHLNKWAGWNAKRKQKVDHHVAPDRNEENLLYQTLVGAWPLREQELPHFRNRLEAYMIKANREAMVHTRWTRPNAPHERAVTRFIKTILKPAKNNLFLKDFLPFQKTIAEHGMLNGLAQVLIKMTSPGVPDFYQGCDLWDLRLVDPDNRGTVDFKYREKLLAEIEKRYSEDPVGYCRELVENWHDGRIKLFLICKILNLRRDHSRMFLEGEFVPVESNGKRECNVIAYARRIEHDWILAVAPRWLARAKAPLNSSRMQEFWFGSNIELPANAPSLWSNVLSGESVNADSPHRYPQLSLSEIFKSFPVAVLAGRNPSKRAITAQN